MLNVLVTPLSLVYAYCKYQGFPVQSVSTKLTWVKQFVFSQEHTQTKINMHLRMREFTIMILQAKLHSIQHIGNSQNKLLIVVVHCDLHIGDQIETTLEYLALYFHVTAF